MRRLTIGKVFERIASRSGIIKAVSVSIIRKKHTFFNLAHRYFVRILCLIFDGL